MDIKAGAAARPAEGAPLSIVVVGASGDLASRKIFPALFALYCQGYLPRRFNVFGFARSAMDHAAFRKHIEGKLACRYVPGESCAAKMSEFLARCHYVSGQYGSSDAYLDLYGFMRQVEGTAGADRIYYLAIPPSIFLEVAHALGGAGLVRCEARGPWSRVVIEKPFGRDRESSDRLGRELAQVFTEEQTYRIDHYLGKQAVQNLLVLRFANTVFEPLWTSRTVSRVTICWKEDIGIEGRGGYFDGYGILRDVMQNHLLQVLSLVAMEPPASADAARVGDAKVAVLRAVPPLSLDDVVLGQYRGTVRGGMRIPGYTEDPSVPPASLTPTYAAVRLRVNTPRWQDVPFVMTAGKGLDRRVSEVTVWFREPVRGIFAGGAAGLPPNHLVIRLQPDEAIELGIVNKKPGLQLELVDTNLDLRYRTAFPVEVPDAYECLLLDVMRGDRSLFIRKDELAAAWDIFTPLLRQIEQRGVKPQQYDFGSEGPVAARDFASLAG